jgi:hypothetical protein
MTALENVALPWSSRARTSLRPRRAELKAVGLGARLHHYPGPALRRRAAAGGDRPRHRAEPGDPVADEPTGNLDENTGESIVDLLFALKRDRGATLILVTHDLASRAAATAWCACAPAGSKPTQPGSGLRTGMHGTLPAAPAAPRPTPAPLVLRLALRELRGGLEGFGIFLACIALGVAAIAGVTSISRSLTEGLTREGRKILGGDMAFSLIHREASPASAPSWRARRGLGHRLHAGHGDAGEKGSGLVELKAVDAAYPAVGDARDRAAAPAADLLASATGAFGAAVDPDAPGAPRPQDRRAGAVGEPPWSCGRASSRSPTRSPTASASARASWSRRRPARHGPLQPGSLVRWTYRLLLPGHPTRPWNRSPPSRPALPEAGWEIRSRVNADPRFARNIERFTQFLTLVGLTALMVGGVGVANAVKGFVDRKRASIAT